MVIEMLEDIHADGGDVDKYVKMAKDPNNPFKLSGFGHRVYKNYDPRARILKETCDELLGELGRRDHLLDLALELEAVALSDEYFIERKLYPNVDFYSGLIYRAMGFPTQMFTVLFAIGRLPGWLAHWKEMIESPATKIGRPRQIYVGPTKRPYVPIDEHAADFRTPLEHQGSPSRSSTAVTLVCRPSVTPGRWSILMTTPTAARFTDFITHALITRHDLVPFPFDVGEHCVRLVGQAAVAHDADGVRDRCADRVADTERSDGEGSKHPRIVAGPVARIGPLHHDHRVIVGAPGGTAWVVHSSSRNPSPSPARRRRSVGDGHRLLVRPPLATRYPGDDPRSPGRTGSGHTRPRGAADRQTSVRHGVDGGEMQDRE